MPGVQTVLTQKKQYPQNNNVLQDIDIQHHTTPQILNDILCIDILYNNSLKLNRRL